MAPNKFEEHLKKQLEEREIRPSSDAWDRLGIKLDTATPPKRKNYFRYAIAASVIGILMFSVFYFNPSSSNIDTTDEVVEVPSEKNIQSGMEEESQEPFAPIEIVDNGKNTSPKSENNGNDSIEITVTTTVSVAVDEPDENRVEQPIFVSTDELINDKILQVVAQVDALETAIEPLSDAEVDSLLRKAQKEVLIEKLVRSDNSVDAMALLSEVEAEMDKSFRDQIFKSLKKGFLKARTAVADRNN